MAETHELRLKINAGAAKSGARVFVSAINGIKRAVKDLDRNADGSFKRISVSARKAAAGVKSSTTAYKENADFIRKAQAGIRSYTAAINKQQSASLTAAAAMRKASEDAARLVERMRRVGDTRGINALNAALNTFRASVGGGVSSTLQLRQAMSSFSEASSKARINLTRTESAQRRTAESARKLARRETDAAAAARRVEREMRSMSGAASAASRSINQASGSMRGLENAFSSSFQIGSAFRVMLGSITFGSFTQAVYRAGTTLEQFRVTMEVATGSAAAAAEEVKFIDDMSRNLGTNLRGAREDFAKFAVSASLAGVNTGTTRDIFESVAMAMSVMGRSAEDQRLAFLALEQMLSKNVVSSEELRRQLGERLPGAVNLMAKAVGVSTQELQKMLKAGALVSSEVLPKFAKEVRNAFGPGFEAATQRASFSLGTFQVEMEKLLEVVANSGFMEATAEGLRDLTSALRTEEAREVARKLGEGLERLARGVFTLAQAFVDNFDRIAQITKAVIGGLIVRQLFRMGDAFVMSSLGIKSVLEGFNALNGASAKTATNLGKVSKAAGAFSVLGRGLGLLAGPAGVAATAIGLVAVAMSGTESEAQKASFGYDDAMDRMGTSTFKFVDRARAATSEDMFDGLKANISSAVAAYEELNRIQNDSSVNQSITASADDLLKLPTKTESGSELLEQVAALSKGFITFSGPIDTYNKKLTELKNQITLAREAVPEAYDALTTLGEGLDQFGRAVITASQAQNKAGEVVSPSIVQEAIDAQVALEAVNTKVDAAGDNVAETLNDIINLFTSLAGSGNTAFAAPVQSLKNLQDSFDGTVGNVEELQSILNSVDYEGLDFGGELVQQLEQDVLSLAEAHADQAAAAEAATVRVIDSGNQMAVAAGQAIDATNAVYGFADALASIPGIKLDIGNTLDSAMASVRERVRLAQINDPQALAVERTLTTGKTGKAVEELRGKVRAAEEALKNTNRDNPIHGYLKEQVSSIKRQADTSIGALREGLTQAEAAEKAQQDAFAAQRKLNRKKSGGGGKKGRTTALRDEKKALQELDDDLLKRQIKLENEERVLRLLASGQVKYRDNAELMAEAMRLNNGVLDTATMKRIKLVEAQQKLNEQLEQSANNPLQDWIDDLQTFDSMAKEMQLTLAQGVSGIIQGVIKNGELDFTQLLDNMANKLAEFAANQLTANLFQNTGLGELTNFAGNSQATAMQAAMVSGGTQAAAAIRTAMTGGSVQGAATIQAAHRTGGLAAAGATQTAGTVNAAKIGAAGTSHATKVGSAIQTSGQAHAAAVAGATGAGAGGGGGFLSFVGSLFGFPSAAQGMTTSGVPAVASGVGSPAMFKHAPHYKEGTNNTSGIPAMLHDNEAVIPLTKGRRVPVELGDGFSGGGSYSSTTIGDINVSVESRKDGETDEVFAQRIAEAMSEQLDTYVDGRIAEQNRYGGILNPR